MLQARALDTLGGGQHDWLKARHHFAVDSQGSPAHARLGSLRGLERRRDRPVQRFSNARASRHGDRHLCARRCPSTRRQFWWCGRDSGGKRAGDHRRPWHSALRIHIRGWSQHQLLRCRSTSQDHGLHTIGEFPSRHRDRRRSYSDRDTACLEQLSCRNASPGLPHRSTLCVA